MAIWNGTEVEQCSPHNLDGGIQWNGGFTIFVSGKPITISFDEVALTYFSAIQKAIRYGRVRFHILDWWVFPRKVFGTLTLRNSFPYFGVLHRADFAATMDEIGYINFQWNITFADCCGIYEAKGPITSTIGIFGNGDIHKAGPGPDGCYTCAAC